MELDIDQGNTRLKWRFSRQGMQHGSLESLLQTVRTSRLKRVRMVSVLSNSRQQQLISLIVVASRLPLTWSIAKSSAECMGVVNGYVNPGQLGPDRWCAMVAAALELQPTDKGLVVLGCGSACTVDFIDAEKRHLGGWIAPGLLALGQGLRQCTSLSFDMSGLDAQQSFGRSTNDCVGLGCNAMIKGLLEHLVQQANRLFAQGWVLVMHGGDAEHVARLAPDDITSFLAAELVFDGLAYVCGKQPHSSPLA